MTHRNTDARHISAGTQWHRATAGVPSLACLVREWEIIEVEHDQEVMRFLYGSVVSDGRGRFQPGDYVFTSRIQSFDEPAGTVQTRNTLYCLEGDGAIIPATLEEAYKVKTIGQSIHVVRAIERDVGTILGPVFGPGTPQ